jgi:aminoglycoside phosphotransferase (APT) family kinase protein
MHKEEIEISDMLVANLMEQVEKFRNLPIKRITSTGTDHGLFRLGEEYLIRIPRIQWATKNTEKEYLWVPKIAPFISVPISSPIFIGNAGDGYPWQWTIVQWNTGENPVFEVNNQYHALALDLANFLNELHKIKIDDAPESRRGVDLNTRNRETLEAMDSLDNKFNIEEIKALWSDLCNTTAYNQKPVWVHGDFLPGNILMENNRLSAVIDFSDLGVGDPACDLIIAWSLLNSQSREIFKNSLHNIDEDTWNRGKGWALSIAIIILPYYKNTNPYLVNIAERIISNLLIDRNLHSVKKST